jgi:hypothetical protein
MKKPITTQDKGLLFNKKNKVSVWVSTHPYADIPEEYFEETFSKNNTRARNQWSDHFKMRYFRPEDMETNGAMEGTINIEKAAGQCSFSSSFISPLLSKAKKKNISEITWIVMLFDYEYSAKLSGVEADEYLTLLGAFSYEDDADSLYEVEVSEES